MMNGLTGFFSRIEYDAEAVLIEVHDLSDFLDRIEHFAGYIGIIRRQGSNALDVFFWNDQNVYRSDGIDVLKGEEIVVFPNLSARDIPGDDLAENAVFHNKFLLLDTAK